MWESAILLLLAFSLFRPDFWWDRVYPADEIVDSMQIYEVIDETPVDRSLRFWVEGETLEGDLVKRRIQLQMSAENGAERRLEAAGILLREESGRLFVDMLGFGSAAEQQGVDFDWEILGVERELDQPSRYWVFLPVGILLGLLGWGQLRRRPI